MVSPSLSVSQFGEEMEPVYRSFDLRLCEADGNYVIPSLSVLPAGEAMEPVYMSLDLRSCDADDSYESSFGNLKEAVESCALL